MNFVSKLLLLIIISIYVFLSESGKDKDKLTRKRSHRSSVEILNPSDIHPSESFNRELTLSSKLRENSDHLLASTSSQTFDSEPIDIENNEFHPKKIKIEDDARVNLSPVPDWELPQGLSTYTSEQLNMIDYNLHFIINNFVSYFPKEISPEVLNTVIHSLQYGLKEYIISNREIDLDTFYENIQNELNVVFEYFYNKYSKKEKKIQRIPLTSFEIFHSNKFIWQHMSSRASNFPYKCIGWSNLLTPTEKLKALLSDYIIFINNRNDIFRYIIYKLINILSNPDTDSVLRLSILGSIDQLQRVFSLFRYYHQEFDTIYPSHIEQKMVLIMCIYYLQNFEEMKNTYNAILSEYMLSLGITDISHFDNSQLILVKNSRNINLFATLVRNFISKHKSTRMVKSM